MKYSIDGGAWPDQAFWRSFRLRLWLGLAATLGIMALWLALMPEGTRDAILGYWSRVELKTPAPTLRPLWSTPLSVQIHVAAAVAGIAIGALIFLLPKGTGFHRLLGWAWVSAMTVVAITSVLMILDLKSGINALHIFTAITVISLWGGLTGIRRGNVKQHAGSMVGLYVGGLMIAGLFAFIPGRTMWQVLFGG